MGKNQSRQQDEKEKDERPNEIKVALIGEGEVGKSALVLQFLSNEFIEVYDPTIEDRFFVCFCFCFAFLVFVLKKWVFSYRKVIWLKDDRKDLLLDLLGLPPFLPKNLQKKGFF